MRNYKAFLSYINSTNLNESELYDQRNGEVVKTRNGRFRAKTHNLVRYFDSQEEAEQWMDSRDQRQGKKIQGMNTADAAAQKARGEKSDPRDRPIAPGSSVMRWEVEDLDHGYREAIKSHLKAVKARTKQIGKMRPDEDEAKSLQRKVREGLAKIQQLQARHEKIKKDIKSGKLQNLSRDVVRDDDFDNDYST